MADSSASTLQTVYRNKLQSAIDAAMFFFGTLSGDCAEHTFRRGLFFVRYEADCRARQRP